MIGFAKKQKTSHVLNALSSSQAIIEFDTEGHILHANPNFLQTMEYDLEEVKGQHHSIFVDPSHVKSSDYAHFWENLRRGEFARAEYQRFGKNGKEVWIQASYNPIVDQNQKVVKIVKFATDITEQKKQSAYYQGQISAIGKSQAVIEFNMDGTIIDANTNFLGAVGYSLADIQGQHHSIFVDPQYARSEEYQAFWAKLRRGEYAAAEYQRFGKDGREIWIQASYNPILDTKGQPFKVVKYATDVTEQKMNNAYFSSQIDAIGKSQAVIEFEMDGHIVNANDNFLNAVGYRLDEIRGQHHRIFVDPQFANSGEYAAFWEKLQRGEYAASEYQRFGKDGREIWIQASYNPIMDVNGRPFRVVKYATDITAQVKARREAGERSAETSMNIEAVAGATEQMLASVQEISQNMSKSQTAIAEIIQKNVSAGALMARLDDNTRAMEGIAGLIRDISEQVNLLALNATIEAARAGDAGKGFAVVAGEVKSLANETAKATDQISEEIARIQAVAGEVLTSGNEIAEATNAVGEYISVIVSAVEEQSAVTHDISANMQKIHNNVQGLDGCIRSIVA